jgi:ribonuclease P protein component
VWTTSCQHRARVRPVHQGGSTTVSPIPTAGPKDRCHPKQGARELVKAEVNKARIDMWIPVLTWTNARRLYCAGTREGPRDFATRGTGGAWGRESKAMTSDDQENLSAEQPPQKAQARLPRAHEDPRGPGHPQVQAREGPRQAVGLTGLVSTVRRPLSLRSSSDFRRVVRTGNRARADGLTVFVMARAEGTAPSRIGMSVRARGSVARNRVRRRLRAAFRVAAPLGYDVVIRAGDEAARQDFQELVKSVKSALTRAVSR